MSSRSDFRQIGIAFGSTLALSWTLMTLGVLLAIWSDRHASAIRLATWASLWVFTVPAPTLSAVVIHRCVRRFLDSGVADDSAIADLARLRPVLLLFAHMALLSACALVFGR